jgi:YegS/Rv2252/BmrU family lipid kinase
MKKRFAFIFNPHAGTQDKKAERAIRQFMESESRSSTLTLTKGKNNATEIARNFAEDGLIPVAVGGDGTVNEVAKALIGTGIPMGIIPKGSGNGVARHLGISLSPSKALKELAQSTPVSFDTGLVNEHPFVMLMGVGFDANVAQRMTLEKRRGLATYIKLVLKEYTSYRVPVITARFEGQTFSEPSFMFNVSNASQFGNNFYQAPEASMQDGKLNLSLIKPFPLWMTPGIVLRMKTKRIVHSSHYIGMPLEEINVLNTISHINVDGESITVNAPLHIKVNKGSLRVLVP